MIIGSCDGSDCGSYLRDQCRATGQQSRLQGRRRYRGNGLSTLVASTTTATGSWTRVYAGDLNGTMYRFDLSSANLADATTTATVGAGGDRVADHPPAQAITSTPGWQSTRMAATW